MRKPTTLTDLRTRRQYDRTITGAPKEMKNGERLLKVGDLARRMDAFSSS